MTHRSMHLHITRYISAIPISLLLCHRRYNVNHKSNSSYIEKVYMKRKYKIINGKTLFQVLAKPFSSGVTFSKSLNCLSPAVLKTEIIVRALDKLKALYK